MSADLHHLAKSALRRAMMAIGRGDISAVDDTKQAQELQLTLLDGETADQMERFQEYGFTSVPFPKAEAIMACVGGLRGHGVIIAVEDRRYRLTNLIAGEVALYDDQGQAVHLKRDGIYITTSGKVVVNATGDVDVTAGGVANIDAATVNLGGAGGPAVARVGDSVNLATGVIETGSAKVNAA